MADDEFYKSLSETDWNKAEAIEAEIAELLHKGLTEDVGLKFVRTVMEVRTAVPDATVEGVFDAALIVGLSYIGAKDILAQMQANRGLSKRRNSGGKRGSTLK